MVMGQDMVVDLLAENARLKVEIADLRETVLWCQRRLPPILQPYVTRMLAGDYVVQPDHGDCDEPGTEL
jgi:hypothetical protein